MELPRDEMAFRKQYQTLLLARQITCVFRPGERLYPNWRGYIVGEIVTARVIEVPGSDKEKIPPVFNDIKVPIRIADIKICPPADLTAEDFAGCSPDLYDLPSLEAQIMAIYAKPLSAYGNLVTRIRFDYVE